MEEYDELSRTLEDFRHEANEIDVPENFFDRIESEIPEQKRTAPPSIKWKHLLAVSGLLVVSLFTIAMFTSGSFYYWVLDFTSIEYDPLDRTIAEGYGQELHLIEEHDDIRLTVTEVVADELATHVYYEIENTRGDEIYALQGSGFIVENWEDIWDELNNDEQLMYELNRMTSHKALTSKHKNIQRGRMELPPIEEKEAIIKLSIETLIPLPSEEELMEMQESGNHISLSLGASGPWQYDIPVKKVSVKEYDLYDQTITVEDIEFTFLTLAAGPTGTQLNYRFQFDRHEQSIHLDAFTPSALLIDDERFRHSNWQGQFNYYDTNSGNKVIFEPILFKDTNNLSVTFDSVRKNSQESMTIDLDETMSFPHAVEFLDKYFTIEKLVHEDDHTSSIVIKDDYYEGRTHETFFINGVFEARDIQTSQSGSAIIVDRHGQEHSSYLTMPQLDLLDEPKYFSTDYEIKFESMDQEPLNLEQIKINGYIENIDINLIFSNRTDEVDRKLNNNKQNAK